MIRHKGSATHFTDRTSRTCIRYVRTFLSYRLVQMYIAVKRTRQRKRKRRTHWRRKAGCRFSLVNENRLLVHPIGDWSWCSVGSRGTARGYATLLAPFSVSLPLSFFLSFFLTLPPPSSREIAAAFLFLLAPRNTPKIAQRSIGRDPYRR